MNIPDISSFLHRPSRGDDQKELHFIGDLFSTIDNEFFLFEFKKLNVKNVSVTANSFRGDVVMSDVKWNLSPAKYDQLIVGIEIAIRQQNGSTISAKWALHNCDPNLPFPFPINASFGNVQIVQCFLAPVNFFKNAHLDFENPTLDAAITRNSIITHALEHTKSETDKACSIAAANERFQMKKLSEDVEKLKSMIFCTMLNMVEGFGSKTWIRVTLYLIRQFEKVTYFRKLVLNYVSNINVSSAKQRLVSQCEDNSIDYVVSVDTWNDMTASGDEVLVLFIFEDAMASNNETIDAFLHMCKESSDRNRRFCVVDLDIIPKSVLNITHDSVIIRKYSNGQFITFNEPSNIPPLLTFDEPNNIPPLLTFDEPNSIPPLIKKNLAKNIKPFIKFQVSKQALLKLTCPGHYSQQCSDEKHQWICQECDGLLYYDFNNRIFCNFCGGESIDNFFFQCENSEHTQFIPLTIGQLKDVKALPPLKEVNILVLGQCGVGKSTWINSAMYCTSLDDSSHKNAILPLPKKSTKLGAFFSGKDKNEKSNKIGKSTTQACRSYGNMWKNMKINMIDTPGLGDAAGIEKDRKTIKKIFDYASNFDGIHGFYIMLNSDGESELFKYSLKEILSCFNQSARNNIVLCWSNANGWIPSGSLLDEIGLDISQKMVFHISTESLKHCFFRKSFVPPDEHKTLLNKCSISLKETMRMFKVVSKLTPHQVGESLPIVRSREKIGNLSSFIANCESEGYHGGKSNASDERNSVCELMIKYAHYLQRNAIVSYNDSLLSRVQSLGGKVRPKEQFRAKINSNDVEISTMKYLVEIEMYRKAAQRTTATLSIDELEKCDQRLFNLEIYGRKIRNLLEMGLVSGRNPTRSGVFSFMSGFEKDKNDSTSDSESIDYLETRKHDVNKAKFEGGMFNKFNSQLNDKKRSMFGSNSSVNSTQDESGFSGRHKSFSGVPIGADGQDQFPRTRNDRGRGRFRGNRGFRGSHVESRQGSDRHEQDRTEGGRFTRSNSYSSGSQSTSNEFDLRRPYFRNDQARGYNRNQRNNDFQHRNTNFFEQRESFDQGRNQRESQNANWNRNAFSRYDSTESLSSLTSELSCESNVQSNYSGSSSTFRKFNDRLKRGKQQEHR